MRRFLVVDVMIFLAFFRNLEEVHVGRPIKARSTWTVRSKPATCLPRVKWKLLETWINLDRSIKAQFTWTIRSKSGFATSLPLVNGSSQKLRQPSLIENKPYNIIIREMPYIIYTTYKKRKYDIGLWLLKPTMQMPFFKVLSSFLLPQLATRIVFIRPN